MRRADILHIAVAALWQQKTRTALTVAGIAIGSFAFAVSLSLGQGFHAEVDRQLNRGDQLRQVWAFPDGRPREEDVPPDQLQLPGDLSAPRRERLRKALVRRWPRAKKTRPSAILDAEHMQALAALEHVEAVLPMISERCDVRFAGQRQPATASLARPSDEDLRDRLIAGDFLPTDDGNQVLIGEYLLYQLGIVSDEQLAGVVGQKLRLTFPSRKAINVPLAELLPSLSNEEAAVVAKAIQQFQAARGQLDLTAKEKELLDGVTRRYLGNAPANAPGFDEELTIVGVVREYTDDDENLGLQLAARTRDVDLFLPPKTAERLFDQGTRNPKKGFDGAFVIVDREENTRAVAAGVKALGLRDYSLTDFVERLRATMKLSTFLTSFLAFVAVLAAALGITNTMLMSVLERTREIGVMKAVGAHDGHVQMMFLTEGALLGAVGGGLGLLGCWLVSFPGDAYARSLLEKYSLLNHLRQTLFVFPWWLVLGVPGFAALVTTLATWLPARRAATVDPIRALRHE